MKNINSHKDADQQESNNLLDLDDYGLKWYDLKEECESKLDSSTLVVDRGRSIRNGGTRNQLIIGDNLISLHHLLKSYRGKVDLVYIDPPYNTGSNGFRYKDDRRFDRLPDGRMIAKDHPLQHSAWLSFMSRRLKKAKELMSPEATIFLSINEDEYAELKLLCDKVFGRANYLTTFVVKVRHEDRILKGDKDFHETYEFLLMYRRSPAFKTIKRLKDNSSIEKYMYEVVEKIDRPEVIELGGKEVEIFRPGEYEVIKGTVASDKLQKINIRGSLKEGNSSGRFHMAHLESKRDEFGVLYKVADIGNDALRHRYFLSRESEDRSNGHYFQGVPVERKKLKEVPFSNLLDFEGPFNKVGFEGGVVFRNGKTPVDVLRYIISIGTRNKEALILDFFAGSGSTGHAVLEQNAIDGGKRRFILCTNNESRIADEVTYPRLKNVIEGYERTRTQKTVLVELKLNPKNVVDNSSIVKARERFISDSKDTDHFDEIQEEVKNGCYRIVGITKKGEKRVLGGSLKVMNVAG